MLTQFPTTTITKLIETFKVFFFLIKEFNCREVQITYSKISSDEEFNSCYTRLVIMQKRSAYVELL